jgi:hypothetical protein
MLPNDPSSPAEKQPASFWPKFVVALLLCHAGAMVLAVNVALSGHDSRDLRDVDAAAEAAVESPVLEALLEAQAAGADQP